MSEVQPGTRPGEPGITLVAARDADGARLDTWLADALGMGRRGAARLADRVRVNGRRASKGTRLAAGDVVSVDPAPSHDDALAARDFLLRSSPDLLVLDKPAGLPAVAVAGSSGASLAGWIRARHPECAVLGNPEESGLVHRLDTDTSGLILAARRPEAYVELREQFRRHSIEKTYLAIVSGTVSEPLSLDAPIGRHPKSRRRMRVVPPPPAGDRYASHPALSLVAPERALAGATLVRVCTRTGVRHQVRVHLAAAGHPLLGDRVYGGPASAWAPGHLLHAAGLTWRGLAGELESAESPLPAHWRTILDDLA
jgi:23S rRNA pseudouridine1911/1915/1917 synthase